MMYLRADFFGFYVWHSVNKYAFRFFVPGFIIFLFLNQAAAQELRTDTYPDGTLKYKGYFVNGKPSGEMLRYYPDGNVKAKMNYRGDTVEVVLYDQTGEYTSVGRYINRKKTGNWEYRKGDWLIRTEEYRDDYLQGVSKRYDRQGQLMEQKGWEKGRVHGEWYLYYENGQLHIKAGYWEGKLSGNLESYDREGRLRVKGKYRNNLKEGVWLFYDFAGNLRRKEVYHAGRSENAEKQESEENRRLDSLISSGRKIVDPAVFINDPDAYIQMKGME